ncbi:hypothetical protein EJB05_16392, partial [Eragrostis curvula]
MDGSACPKEFGIDGKRDDGSGHRVETSLLPLKKRALNATSSSGDSFSCPPKWRRIDDCARATPVAHHDAPAVAMAVAGGDATPDGEKLRLSKGKGVAAAETSSVAAPQPHVEKKLMHDGIRSGAWFNEEVLFAATAATEKKKSNDTDAGSVFSEALERRLEQLGATRPWFVYRKRLEKSDACPNQNRLLISCKRDSLAGCPITGCFSAAEMRRVEDKNAGLFVTALDGRGERYFPLTCKFLDSNGGYRFISKWRAFLERNGLALRVGKGGSWTRDVDLELWAFRSRELPRQPRLDGAGKPVSGEEEAEHFHPDGSLGLILLHHEQRRKQCGGEHEEGKGGKQGRSCDFGGPGRL